MNRRQRRKIVTENFNKIMQNNLLDLAMIYFYIKKYTTKLIDEHNLKNSARAVENSINKLENFLQDFNIQVFDYTGAKFNESMNIDIIETIRSDIQCDVINETIEPSIIINDKLVKKARVIKEIPKEEK